MYETISVDHQDGVAHVVLDRPEVLNAVNHTLSEELTNALFDLAEDDTANVIVLSGNGDSFCSGADLSDETSHSYESIKDYTSRPRVFDAISACPQPVISAVHGWAIGAGFQYPLWCDIIYAAESAKFQLTQVSLGIMPAYAGAVQLQRWVGKGNAAEIALMGEPVEATEAHRIGLVQEVLEDKETLLEYTLEQAHQLAEMPPASTRITKESLLTGMDMPLAHAQTADQYRFYSLSETEDSEAIHEAERERHSSD